MLKTILVTGGNRQNRQAKIEKIIKQQSGLNLGTPHPDLFWLQGVSSITIEQIRNLKILLTRKAYQSPIKIAVVSEAEKMTAPAQNAFLKTLEETPINSLIILATPTPEYLLPTILSRCQLMTLAKTPELTLSDAESADYGELFLTLPNKSAGVKLLHSAKYASKKETTLDFALKMMEAGRNLLRENPSLIIGKNLGLWQKAYRILQANVNPQLALGNLFLLLS
jgi:DNA polymerase III delta prime subunit